MTQFFLNRNVVTAQSQSRKFAKLKKITEGGGYKMNFSRLNKKELTKEILEIDSIIGISF